MTTTDFRPTTADQITAAGTLLALLHAHSALPTATIQLQYLRMPDTRDFLWGLEVALHNGLDHFEQWRHALGIDPAAVDHHTAVHGTLAWLTATTPHSGIPLKLTGFYHQPEPTTLSADTSEEPATDSCHFCGESKPDVTVQEDPFALELNNESWSIPICDDCLQLRCDEI
ncbi:hypothetical protein [Kitasatospora sp. NPDC096204]|uniref:hypothetical protein n=1 Tax=Kitasatospora sp. NPDC096204 TaxID=3364094 RepID=UPI0037FD4B73